MSKSLVNFAVIHALKLLVKYHGWDVLKQLIEEYEIEPIDRILLGDVDEDEYKKLFEASGCKTTEEWMKNLRFARKSAKNLTSLPEKYINKLTELGSEVDKDPDEGEIYPTISDIHREQEDGKVS